MSTLIQEIQQMRLQATSNQSKKLDDGTMYHWADEQAILDVLQPVLEKENAYLVWTLDSIEGNNVVALSLYENDHVILTRATVIGETRNNNEFTARCTTIRRDMLSMMFMIRTVVVGGNANDTTTVEETTKDKPAVSEAFNAASKKIELAKENAALMVLKDAISNSKKLTGDEKISLFEKIADKIDNGDSIE